MGEEFELTWYKHQISERVLSSVDLFNRWIFTKQNRNWLRYNTFRILGIYHASSILNRHYFNSVPEFTNSNVVDYFCICGNCFHRWPILLYQWNIYGSVCPIFHNFGCSSSSFDLLSVSNPRALVSRSSHLPALLLKSFLVVAGVFACTLLFPFGTIQNV